MKNRKHKHKVYMQNLKDQHQVDMTKSHTHKHKVNRNMLNIEVFSVVYCAKPSSVTTWSRLVNKGKPDSRCVPNKPRPGIGFPVSCNEMKIAGMV